MKTIRGRLLPSTVRLEDRNEIGFWASGVDQELLMRFVERCAWDGNARANYNGYVTEANMELHNTDGDPIFVVGTLMYLPNVPCGRFISLPSRMIGSIDDLLNRVRISVGRF